MKEFIMSEYFESVALLSKYISTRRIPKRKIISVFHNGRKYVLIYYTTIKKEEKFNKSAE